MTFAQTWRDFTTAPLTLGPSPGIREQWRQGRQWYAVWVLRVSEPRVHARMAMVAAPLGSAVRPFLATEAHITLFVSGFPTADPRLHDDVAADVLLRQRDALVAADLSLTLTVGGCNSFTTAAFLEVHEDGGLTAIRRLLAGAADEQRPGPYHPHVTVGVYRDARPTSPLVAALSPLRDAPLIPLHPTVVELVVFDAAVEGSPLLTRHAVRIGP
ncbi:MAG: 2'-5' RNA ligase family protein [Myxococcota bacterium]|nr:2'-5' RNA ligase family protein [Myxococcota bacterium]